jgi:microcystin-dependent protein
MYKYTDNQTSGVLASREAAHATSVIKINAMSNYLQIEGDYRENPDINIGDNAIIKSNTYSNVGIYKTPTNGVHKFDVNGTLNANKIYENSYQNGVVFGTFQLIPAGSIIAFGGSSGDAPDGWLLCDGAEYDVSRYFALFAAIANTYGSTNPGIKFNVPNLKGRVIVQRDASNSKFNTMGEIGGAETHTLITDEMPTHNHGVTDPGHSHTYLGVNSQTVTNLSGDDAADDIGRPTENTGSSTTGITINNTGGGLAHNNLQPYLVMSYIIKY